MSSNPSFAELDRQLAARGWRYDAEEEDFFAGAGEGNRRLQWEEVLQLAPEQTLDWLASYQDDRHDELRVQRLAATHALDPS